MQNPTTAQRDDEVFDVVDLQDRVLGQSTRKEVHARKLLHRAVHVVLFDSRGRVFLQKRSLEKDTFPGCWDSSCSGHLDSGEDYRVAALRELEEEIGVRVFPERLVLQLKLSAEADTGWEFVSIYTLRYDGPIVINPVEIELGQWFEPSAVSRAMQERPQEFATTLRKHWPVVSATMARLD